MRYVFSLFVTLLLACGSVLANGPLLQKLQQIKEISGIRELKVQPYTEYYEFWYEQPIDHNNPSKGTFKQRVLLGHRDFNAPMVAILEGYLPEQVSGDALIALIQDKPAYHRTPLFQQQQTRKRNTVERLNLETGRH